jgi:hypothetical protein
MTGIDNPQRARTRLFLGVLGAAVLVGACLRLTQVAAQVLIDDEWHAVHQVLTHTPREMLLDFGYADYSIPLGILDWWEAKAWGLSELTLRWPMLFCGLATLVMLPLYVARRLGRPTAAVFALLLAISPLLVIFTRMARPYAITLLLGWIAHGAYQRYHTVPRGRWIAGTAYALSAAIATWLHPVVGAFAVAPLLWGFAQLRNARATERRDHFFRWFRLALATGVLIAAAVLPPLVVHPGSLAAKSGINFPDAQTLIGVWYAWFGTSSTVVVLICAALAAYGAPVVWRTLAVARTGALGVVLTLLLVVVAGTMWSQLPVTLARYLLPFIPLLLMAVAAGAVRLAGRAAIPPTPSRRALVLAAMALPVVLLAVQSPLAFLFQRPNAQTQHLVNYIDFRPDHNPYVPWFDATPLSPFWGRLRQNPAGSVRIAAAPFYFESFDWDAPRWERLSGQTVLPGYLTGLCVKERAGEVPQDSRFRFDNAVRLADAADLRLKRIDYVVWQKPYVRTIDGSAEQIGTQTAACEGVLRQRFGPPAFEDSHIIVFSATADSTPSPNAPR